MAVKVWQSVKVQYCEHAGADVALEVEAIYPSEILPDTGPRVTSHRCSKAKECMLIGKAACVWNGGNPAYDPFAG